MRTMTKLLMLMCLLPIGQAIHAQALGTVTYEYTDQQGTPLAETSASGTITATFDYTPYGSTAMGSPPNGPGYTGHVNDPETNLVYMQARYYDATTGRFLSIDPVHVADGEVLDFGRYGYADENPIRNFDPTGKYSCPEKGSFCPVIDQFVAALHADLYKLKPMSSDYHTLQRAILEIGDKDDPKHGPTYVPGSIQGKGFAQTNQNETTTVDLSKVKTNPDGTVTDPNSIVQGEAALAHEATHDIDDKKKIAVSEDDFRKTETHAYGATNAVLRANGKEMSKEEMHNAIETSVHNDVNQPSTTQSATNNPPQSDDKQIYDGNGPPNG